MTQNKIIKLDEVAKILELSYPEFEQTNLEFKGFTNENKSNAIILDVSKDKVNEVISSVNNSLIIVNDTEDYCRCENSNIIVGSSDYYKLYLQLYKGFKIDHVIIDKELDVYPVIMKKCIIISKTAKLYNCWIGKACSIHHNVLIGVDNLNTTRVDGILRTIPTIGLVDIGNYVDIFNNSIIYRGYLGITKIGNNVKIGSNSVIESDAVIGNNVRIGHNCVIKSGAVIPDDSNIESGTVVN